MGHTGERGDSRKRPSRGEKVVGYILGGCRWGAIASLREKKGENVLTIKK